MSIQSSINSMIGSTSRAVMAVKGFQTLQAKQKAAAEKTMAQERARAEKEQARVSTQEQAAAKARQSASDAISMKKKQRRNFMEYLAKQPSNLGKIGNLDPQLQKKIAQQYTPTMRRKLMDTVDKEAKNGKH